MTHKKFTKGFSAIELMTALTAIAIISALAIPSFSIFIEKLRVEGTAKELQATLYFARSEAIKRGGQVAIQKIINNTGDCKTAITNRDWDCGWIVCHDTNDNGVCNTSEPTLQRVGTLAKVHVSRTGGSYSIKFNRWGLVDGAWLGFSIVPQNKSITHPGARGVCMSSGGRIRIISQEDIPCTS